MSPCFHYTNHLFVFYIVRIWLKSFTLYFQSFPCSPDCNVFDSACTDNSSFLCSSSSYLIQISWIFRIACVPSPGHGIHRCSPATSFPRHFLNQCVKELLLCSFPNLSRCKIVAARTTYFIRSWTYLCTVRDTHETELVRECEPDEIRTRDLSLRRRLLFRWATGPFWSGLTN